MFLRYNVHTGGESSEGFESYGIVDAEGLKVLGKRAVIACARQA